MSQANFIEALVRRLPAAQVLDAVTDGVDAATARDHVGIFMSASKAAGVLRIKVIAKLLDYVYNIDATEQQKSRVQWRSPVMEAVVQEVQNNPLAPDEQHDNDLRSAIDRVVAEDDIETFVALDKAGLIDRSAPIEFHNLRVSDLTHYFSLAIGKEASRCNKYLLATSANHLLPSFPGEERTWPKSNLTIARDIVSHISDSDLPRCIEVLAAGPALAGSGAGVELREKAECVAMALLERAVDIVGGTLDAAGERVLAGAIGRSINGHGSGMHREAERVLVDVLRLTNRLDTKEAFQITSRVLKAEKEGRLDLPSTFLKPLIEAGLPVQSAPGWYKDGHIMHMMSAASAKHYDVLTHYVGDKVQFMQEFGPQIALSHSEEPCHRAGNLRGAGSAELVRLAELGFPLGPIEVKSPDGEAQLLALYERFDAYNWHRAADSYVVGHLMGHLDASHTYDGAGPMHVAVAYKSPETVLALAKAGLPIDEPCAPSRDSRYGNRSQQRSFHGYAGMTPLIMALKVEDASSSERLVHALIASGADTKIKAPTGASAVQLAKTPEMKDLLRSGRTLQALEGAVGASGPASPRGTRKTGLSPL